MSIHLVISYFEGHVDLVIPLDGDQLIRVVKRHEGLRSVRKEAAATELEGGREGADLVVVDHGDDEVVRVMMVMIRPCHSCTCPPRSRSPSWTQGSSTPDPTSTALSQGRRRSFSKRRVFSTTRDPQTLHLSVEVHKK